MTTGADGSPETGVIKNDDIVISPQIQNAIGLRKTIDRAKEIEKERSVSRPNELPAQRRKHAIASSVIETTKELALKDSLTGLHNRTWFEDDLDIRISTAARNKTPLYVVYMDFDDFKDYNTIYDHSGGDAVLRLASDISSRPDETLSRFGGDEFIQSIEHENLTQDEIRLMLKRYQEIMYTKSRELLPQLPIIQGTEPDAIKNDVTLTFGIAKYEGETRDELIRKANLAMHHAKKLGKNTAFIAERNLNSEEYNFTQIN